MRLPFTLFLTLLAHDLVFAARPAKPFYNSHHYYVLEHDPHAGASLDECARSLGVEIVDQAGELQNHWLARIEKPVQGLISRAPSDPVLETFKTLKARAISNRDSVFSRRSSETQRARRVVSSIKYFERQTLRRRVKRDDSLLQRTPQEPGPDDTPNANASGAIAQRMGFVDPLFTKQWHLVNDEFPQHMMNPVPVWDMGITGEGVISAMVDDGLEWSHNDLAANFDAAGSYDFNTHVDLPTPTLADDHHGTRCAGQIAAVKNDICGVGIAYKSKIAGLRILSGFISDADEAAALNYAYQNTSIYSCSWGPPDDGKSMEAPGYLIKKAVVNGIQNGRGGKGSIFVFAAGNGAANGDQCNFDGYTNSIYSITVAAVDYKGLHPYYSEPCAANMVVAYSSGSGNHIVTTDRGQDKCSSAHGGTSAAAPNAAGVFALALSARPDLGWRDLQHLCVNSAQMINPEDPDWEKISNDRLFSYKYGFGKIDAYEFVKAAQTWQLVKPQAWVRTPVIQLNNGTMTADEDMSGGEFISQGGISHTIEVTQDMLQQNNFDKLEHVNVQVWITHGKRGDVTVELTSPHGISSILAAPRNGDMANTGFPGWTFMSLKHWDEDPVGTWTIHVGDQGSATVNGSFLGWGMTFWGSSLDPSQAKTYELQTTEAILPPLEQDLPTTTSSAVPSSSKTHAKPTDHLPGDHGTAEGDASKPAFPGGQEDTTEPSSTPTPDEGWFPSMSKLVSDRKWFFGAITLVAIFAIAAGLFFWRRRASRRRAAYAALGGEDDVAMRSIATGPPRTKELYDAFGEVSDDEDADEETGLRPDRGHDASVGGLGFHSGFLDDEEPASAPPEPLYKDEPDDSDRRREVLNTADREGSSSSGDGSWEHASQIR